MTITPQEIPGHSQPPDAWLEWFLRGRAGGDDRERERLARNLEIVRDRILAGARLRPGDVIIDLGCGVGLLGLGALAQEASARVVFVDQSPELLAKTETEAKRLGFAMRCSFLLAAAESFAPALPDGANVVVSRSVMIHIRRKREVFRQIYAALRAGGRLSLCEPVNRWSYPEPPNRFWGYDVTAVHDIAAKLKSLYHSCIVPGSDPFVDFDECDLWDAIEAAGFRRIEMQVRRKSDTQTRRRCWKTFVATQWNPRTPSLADAMRMYLSECERAMFISHLRPRVESGIGETRWCVVYARAMK